jgi:uncharacterized protein (TIGR03083 family)
MGMDFARHCTEITRQTELLVADVDGADLRLPVPSCPGWTLGMLLRHVGEGHRWAARTVATRATEYLPDRELRVLDGDDSGSVPTAWLLAGAAELTATLERCGPDVELFAPFDYDRTSFWARRFANETVVHRADACQAAGAPFAVEPHVAVESIDEWLELDVHPAHFDMKPAKRDVLGPGRTIQLVSPEASWHVDLTGDVIAWARGRREAAVTLEGDVTALLLVLYGRLGRHATEVEVSGDAALLDLWLGAATFG